MTQSLPAHTPADPASRMLVLLERHSAAYPQIEEELRRHRALAASLAEQRLRAEQTLGAWQAALARRWSCEVAAQRAYSAVQSEIIAHCDAALSGPLLLSTLSSATRTPSGLLDELRRLEVTVTLLALRYPLSDEGRARLRTVGDELAQAIARTDACEAERRSALSEQRVVANLLEGARSRAQRLLSRYDLEAEPG